MKERPILFKGEMVRAILDGRKTQTRRVVKPQPFSMAVLGGAVKACWSEREMPCYQPIRYAYGEPGDRLWVKETWRVPSAENGLSASRLPRFLKNYGEICYTASDDHLSGRNRPSIFMPRWASRITLEITGVRVERLQEISARDCEAEGLLHAHRGWWVNPYAKDVPASGETEGSYCYRKLWDSINSKTHPWASNPWVWVIEFRKLNVGEPQTMNQ